MPEPMHMTPVTGQATLRLKCWQPGPVNGGRPLQIAGQEWPSQVGATLAGATRVLCIAPGDWLVISDEHSATSLSERLAANLARHSLVLVDLTEGLVGLEVAGSMARELLSRACGLDFHPDRFPPGCCARTRFAHIPVVVDCLDEISRFRLYAVRSHLHYLQSWLIDATTGLGYRLT